MTETFFEEIMTRISNGKIVGIVGETVMSDEMFEEYLNGKFEVPTDCHPVPQDLYTGNRAQRSAKQAIYRKSKKQ